MKEVKEFVDRYSKLLALNKSISTSEAEKHAGEFLLAMAKLTDVRHLFAEDKIQLTSLQTAVYAEEMSKGTAKTVTENKMMAEATAEYTKAREDLERVDNDIAYLRAYYDIFNNAHLFYRNMAKGESF